MRAIFVSYRRDDSEGEAGRLFDDLAQEFGEKSVFMDVAAIEVGRDFRKVIDDSVATCGVLLAVIGREWTDAKNEAGQRRLDDPADFVRLETASALRRDIPVVPVLVHGARMPRADQLPDDLKELAYRNGVEVTHARWKSDVQLLIKALRPHVEDRKHAPSSPSQAVVGGTAVKKAPSPVVTTVPEVAAGPSSTSGKKPLGIILAVAAAVLVIGAVVAYMTLGPKQVIVPDLSGATLQDATAKLEALHLAVGRRRFQPDATKDPNVVLNQSPAPNEQVKSGTKVDLVLSQPTMVEVPSLVGKSLDAAQQVLEDLHLPAGKISFEQKPNVAENIVLEQFPKPGKKVEGTAEISLVVSEAQVTSATKGQPPPSRVSNPHPVTPQEAQVTSATKGQPLPSRESNPHPVTPQKVEGTAEISPVVSGTPVTSATKEQPPPSRVSNPHPVTPQSVWAVGDHGTILRTEDGGVTWIPQSSGTSARLLSVAFVTPQSGWAVGLGGTILHTENGGGTWKAQTSGTTQALWFVAFATPQSGWAVGNNGTILHTEDGGGSWKPRTSSTGTSVRSVAFATPQSGWAVGAGGTILHTEDGGGSWKPGSSGTNYPLYSVTFATHQSGWAVGGKAPTCIILHTEDGGGSWKPQSNSNNAALYSVVFPTPQLAWAVGYGGSILHTEDGGGSWKPQTSGTTEWLRSVAFATPQSGWAVGGVDPKSGASKAIILHTEDGGGTWQAQSSGTSADLYSVAFAKSR